MEVDWAKPERQSERRHLAGKLAAGSRQDAGAPGDVPNPLLLAMFPFKP